MYRCMIHMGVLIHMGVYTILHIHQVCVSIRSTGYVVVRQMAISSQCHER